MFCRMTAAECLAQERIWFDKPRYDEAERQFYERMNGPTQPKQVINISLELLHQYLQHVC